MSGDLNDVVGGEQAVAELAEILRCGKPVKLERLVGRLLGVVLGVPFRFARGGDQHGGDGATREPGLRAIKYEARRYRETTPLDERRLIGQIEQAVVDNPDLEAWVLATTREVSEQTHGAITKKATKEGIAAVVIDWSPLPLPRLAALCATDAGAFEAEYGSGHRELLAGIAATEGYDTTLAEIKRSLENWFVGYELVRNASHLRLEEIWRSRPAAWTHFGQDVAGGSEEARHVRRDVVAERLDGWFDDAEVDCPALVVGQEGMGKTWSVMDWLQASRDKLPIVVLAPAAGVGAGDLHDVFEADRTLPAGSEPRHRTTGAVLGAKSTTASGTSGAGGADVHRVFRWAQPEEVLRVGCGAASGVRRDGRWSCSRCRLREDVLRRRRAPRPSRPLGSTGAHRGGEIRPRARRRVRSEAGHGGDREESAVGWVD